MLRHFLPVSFFLAALAVAACTDVASKSPTDAQGRMVVIDPRLLLNRRLELLDQLSFENPSIQDDIRRGRYRLLIMHSSCPDCQHLLETLKTTRESPAKLIVLDLAQEPPEDPLLLAGVPTLRIPARLTVSAPIPLLLELQDGVVTRVQEEFP